VFLDFLAGVTRQSQRTPIMLLCLARPELLELRPDWLDAAELHIRLEPLGSTESARVIGRILDGAELPEQLRARVIELAQGNPLFIEELLGMLIDEGLVRPGADTEIAIPATLEALLAARLDRLDRPQRDTIESAAVEGHLFHRGAVEAICAPQRRGEVPPALDALVAGDFTRPAPPAVVGDAAFRFRHAMIRDAAYRGVAKSARAELHEHLAGWLESTAGPAEGDGDELVGFHLEHAYRYRAELGLLDERAAGLARRAAERLGRAGRRGLLVRLDPAAASLLDRAASLLPEDDPLRRRLLTDLASALFLVGNYRRADAVLTEAIERARAAGDRHTLLEAELERASTRLRMNPHESPDEVVRLAETAVEVFRSRATRPGLRKPGIRSA
jgi:predicted ATPase